MNRHILFRAKRKDNGEWVYGYYATQSNHACFQSELKYTSFILKDEFMDWGLGGLAEYEVIPESVGQFTGLTDKKGKKIFEGDIVRYETIDRNGYDGIYKVVFEDRNGCGYFGIAYCDIETCCFCYSVPASQMEVIGNIYDNLELLRSENEQRTAD